MIQIDMDMPVSCFYCPIKERILTLGGKYMCFCGLSKHELNDTTKRHESCPLIEVKDGERPNVHESAKDADYPLRLCKRCRLSAE